MPLLEHTVTRPYPRQKLVNYLTIAFITVSFILLGFVNVIAVGYELVPTLRPVFEPNDTTPEWWTKARLPGFMRGQVQPCQPQDIGRGDSLRVSPALFEYKVLSSWHGVEHANATNSTNEGRFEYKGESFHNCWVYNVGFDFNLLELTQTLTVAIECPTSPIVAYMESEIIFSETFVKDHVGKYYGSDIDPSHFINETSRDYRQSVFGLLDVITGDSFTILLGNYLTSPVLSFSAIAGTISGAPTFDSASTIYVNGTVNRVFGNDTLGDLEIYRGTISNVIRAVQHAVLLDLGNAGPGNIFVNHAAVNYTFDPNLRPGSPPGPWDDTPDSFNFGAVPSPYRTWAEALRAGEPNTIPLGNLTGLPPNSTMITNYLCPSYALKSTGSLIVTVFIATATMVMSIWPIWGFLMEIWATKSGPSPKSQYSSPLLAQPEKAVYDYEHDTLKSGTGTEFHVPLLINRS